MALKHHLAWLSLHPDRSAEWLAAHIRDGFDVHHVDGNSGNDDPRNLALMESADHARLHTGGLVGPIQEARAAKAATVEERAARAYEIACSGATWTEIAGILRYPSKNASCAAAKRHAQRNGAQWPPPNRVQFRTKASD